MPTTGGLNSRARPLTFSHFPGVIGAPIPHCPSEPGGAVMVIDEKDVFVAASALPGGEERDAYLQAACAGHPELLGRVRELLSAHEGSQGPLDRGPAALGVTADAERAEGPGSVIGPYKLLQQIGEGGMGTVWLAQQQEPVRRLVAVKLIK